MEEKKNSNMGLIIILGVLVLGLAGYICYDKFYKKENGKEVKTKDEVKGTIDFDPTKYIGYIPLERNSLIYNCAFKTGAMCDNDSYDYVDAYSMNKVTIEDINETLLLNTGLLYAKKAPESEYFESDFDICGKDSSGSQLSCTLSEYYLATDVINEIKKMYNVDVTPKDFNVPGGKAYYKNGYFAVAYAAGNTPVEKVSEMEKTEIVNGELQMIERATFKYDLSTKTGSVVEVAKKTNYDTKDIIYSGTSVDDIQEANKVAYQNIKESYRFKHIFKKSSTGEYYWYSTEIIN